MTIPAPGFRLVSGKRGPPAGDNVRYQVQFRNGFIDQNNTYTAGQLRWKHDGSDWDVVAVRKV